MILKKIRMGLKPFDHLCSRYPFTKVNGNLKFQIILLDFYCRQH
jgi:hypothetical protein